MTESGAGAPPRVAGRLAIGIKVASLDPTMASVWYRGLYPAVNLRRLGHTVTVFDRVTDVAALRRFDVLVIVKPGALADLQLATAARDLGVPLVLDLCDDVFIPGYGSVGGRETMVCQAIAAVSMAVVTTGPVLAGKLRAIVAADVPVVEIADPVENEADNAAVMAAFGGDFARKKRRRWMQRVGRIVQPRRRLHALRARLALRRRIGQLLRRTSPTIRQRLLTLESQLRPRRRLRQARDLLHAAPRALARARRVPLAEWPRRLPGAVWRRLAYLFGPVPAPATPARPALPAPPPLRPAAAAPRPPAPAPPPPLPLPKLPPMPAAARRAPVSAGAP